MPTNIAISTPHELSKTLTLLRERCLSKNEDQNMLIGRTAMSSIIFINKGMSTFTLRKTEPQKYHPLAMLMRTGLGNIEMLAFIGFFLKNKGSILIIGPKESNKTELISGICSTLENSKITTFENMPELNLTSNMWISETLQAHAYSQSDVVENVLRQSPDYVIANNIRGTDLERIMKGFSKDYAGIVAVDAKSVEEGMRILQSSIGKNSLANFDIVILLTVEKKGAHYIQRIREIDEVLEYSSEDDKLKLNTVFKWDKNLDNVLPLRSVLIGKFVKKTGKSAKVLINELKYLVRSMQHLSR
jgi:type IV secretory pathway ATPase VirB11/archaellum biosynthesis ATPase